jgi:hypothetical protein
MFRRIYVRISLFYFCEECSRNSKAAWVRTVFCLVRLSKGGVHVGILTESDYGCSKSYLLRIRLGRLGFAG